MNTTTLTRPTPQKYGFESRIEVREKDIYKQTHGLWNAYNLGAKSLVGNLSQLFEEHNPQTLSEWVKVYLAYGRSEAQLDEITEIWFQALSRDYFLGESLDAQEQAELWDDAKCIVLIHILDLTYEGFTKEAESIPWLAAFTGLEIVKAETAWDTNFSVDLVGLDAEGRVARCFQVKSNRGYLHSRNAGCVKDRERTNAKVAAFYDWQEANRVVFIEQMPKVEFIFFNELVNGHFLPEAVKN